MGDTPAVVEPYRYTLVRDFCVDFFGSFVPGMLLVTACTLFSLFVCAMVADLIAHINPPKDIDHYFLKDVYRLLSYSLSSPSQSTLSLLIQHYHFEYALIFSISSYAAGCVLLRMDPKEPDRASVLRQKRNTGRLLSEFERKVTLNKLILYLFKKMMLILQAFSNFHRLKDLKQYLENRFQARIRYRKRLLEQIRKIRKDLYSHPILNDPYPEFPYANIKDYLKTRNMGHLEEYIPWPDKNRKEARFFRSKTFVTTLKLRIQILDKDNYGEIIKNEAHIRLMSSLWYALNFMMRLLYIFGLLYVGAIVLSFVLSKMNHLKHQEALFFSLSAFFIAGIVYYIILSYFKTKIESIFNYMRIRELIYILETAHSLSRKCDKRNFIFNGIDTITPEEGESIKASQCAKRGAPYY
jgi:hypothetical protein